MKWKTEKHINGIPENVMLAYFGELAQKYSSSSLWTFYSMLRSTLNINNNIEIEKYSKLRAFLKRKSHGFQAKKSKILNQQEIKSFLKDAPDQVYLDIKVGE